MLEFLCVVGSDVEAKNVHGATPVHSSVVSERGRRQSTRWSSWELTWTVATRPSSLASAAIITGSRKC